VPGYLVDTIRVGELQTLLFGFSGMSFWISIFAEDRILGLISLSSANATRRYAILRGKKFARLQHGF
jgi:hypothetical protein